MGALIGNIAWSYFNAEAQRSQGFAESNRWLSYSALGGQLKSWDGYPPLAACTEPAEVEVPSGRRWTLNFTNFRHTEITDIFCGCYDSALGFVLKTLPI